MLKWHIYMRYTDHSVKGITIREWFHEWHAEHIIGRTWFRPHLTEPCHSIWEQQDPWTIEIITIIGINQRSWARFLLGSYSCTKWTGDQTHQLLRRRWRRRGWYQLFSILLSTIPVQSRSKSSPAISMRRRSLWKYRGWSPMEYGCSNMGKLSKEQSKRLLGLP